MNGSPNHAAKRTIEQRAKKGADTVRNNFITREGIWRSEILKDSRNCVSGMGRGDYVCMMFQSL